MKFTALTDTDRRTILTAIRARLARVDPQVLETTPVDGPGSFADIERHLDVLVGIVRRCSADRAEPYLALILEELCPHCPYQSVNGSCPLRKQSGCLIYKHARAIAEAIQGCLPDLQRPPAIGSSGRKERPMFKKILLCVDRAESTARLVKNTKVLAERFDAKVGIVHVVQLPLALPPAMAFDNVEVEQALREQGQELLDSVRAQLPEGMVAEEFLQTGAPADQIIAAIRTWKADLVVVGDRNRQGLSRFLLGSTADAVVRRAPCPVLVIRDVEHGDVSETVETALQTQSNEKVAIAHP